jgi:5-carboxymethyl-2-hydroxymuconate isomerase
MPHVIVECSANLAALVDLDELLRRLHDAALATGVFPLGGLRTRLHLAERYRVADGNPANAFVHVEIAVGQGRDMPTRRRAAETVFHALCAALDERAAGHPLALSLELRELAREISFRRNNIHDRVAPAVGRR